MNDDFAVSGLDGYASESLDEDTVRYLDRYWIDRQCLENEWAELIVSVFKRSEGSISIAPDNRVKHHLGGILFTKEEFHAFVERAKMIGAIRFVVIEDVGQANWDLLRETNFFRFSYPIDVGWDEMTHSSILAEDVFGRPIRCFFVITDNGKLGKYTNNDADPPYDLMFETPETSARALPDDADRGTELIKPTP